MVLCFAQLLKLEVFRTSLPLSLLLVPWSCVHVHHHRYLKTMNSMKLIKSQPHLFTNIPFTKIATMVFSISADFQ